MPVIIDPMCDVNRTHEYENPRMPVYASVMIS